MVEALLAHTLFGEILGIAAQKNIRSASRHVGCDCNRIKSARLRDDFRLALVVLCVKNVVLNAVSAQKTGNFLRFFNRNGTYKNRLSLCVALYNLVDNRLLFALYRGINHVRIVNSLHGAVCRDRHNVQSVNRSEFVLFRHCGTGHARKL